MRKTMLGFILLILTLTSGCAKHVVAPVPGQLNTFDAYAYRVLADAQAAINDFKGMVSTGKVAETPALKTVLNQAITDYNSANVVYQGWHAAGGTAPTTQVSAALNQVNADITNITAQAGGK